MKKAKVIIIIFLLFTAITVFSGCEQNIQKHKIKKALDLSNSAEAIETKTTLKMRLYGSSAVKSVNFLLEKFDDSYCSIIETDEETFIYNEGYSYYKVNGSINKVQMDFLTFYKRAGGSDDISMDIMLIDFSMIVYNVIEVTTSGATDTYKLEVEAELVETLLGLDNVDGMPNFDLCDFEISINSVTNYVEKIYAKIYNNSDYIEYKVEVINYNDNVEFELPQEIIDYEIRLYIDSLPERISTMEIESISYENYQFLGYDHLTDSYLAVNISNEESRKTLCVFDSNGSISYQLDFPYDISEVNVDEGYAIINFIYYKSYYVDLFKREILLSDSPNNVICNSTALMGGDICFYIVDNTIYGYDLITQENYVVLESLTHLEMLRGSDEKLYILDYNGKTIYLYDILTKNIIATATGIKTRIVSSEFYYGEEFIAVYGYLYDSETLEKISDNTLKQTYPEIEESFQQETLYEDEDFVFVKIYEKRKYKIAVYLKSEMTLCEYFIIDWYSSCMLDIMKANEGIYYLTIQGYLYKLDFCDHINQPKV